METLIIDIGEVMETETKAQEETQVSFVTKKVLVSFRQPVAFPIDGIVIASHTAICEITETAAKERYSSFPTRLRVVGFSDRKLAKSLQLTIDHSTVVAMVLMED